MKLVFIRHGEPDYVHDSLTEKGWKEAELLSERISKMNVTAFYVSPLGRAKDTASFTLKRMHCSAQTKEWLQEFDPRIHRPDDGKLHVAWDWYPDDWMIHPEFFDKDQWYENPVMQEGHVKERYDWVCHGIDELLQEHGYVRNSMWYHCDPGNHETLVFFCHFGVTCVILSHLLNISPMQLWHGFVSLPTGVTIVNTEERAKGIASWRVECFGDLSHLYVAEEPASFAARYCECYDDNEKH